MPGKYPLPYFEGTYKIDSNQYGEYRVTMNTNGNTQIYQHPLSNYSMADRVINAGTLQYFNDVCSTKQRATKLKFSLGPAFNTDRCYFMNLMIQIISQIKNAAFVSGIVD